MARDGRKGDFRTAALLILLIFAGVILVYIWLGKGGTLRLPEALFQRMAETPKSRVDLYIYDVGKVDYSVASAEVQKIGSPSFQISEVVKTCCSKFGISCPDFYVFFESNCLTLVPHGASLQPDEPVFEVGSISDEIAIEKSITKTLEVLLKDSAPTTVGTALQIAFFPAEPNQKIWRHLRPTQCQ